jgi:hypothetical protein
MSARQNPSVARSAIGHTHTGQRPQRGAISGGVGGSGTAYPLQQLSRQGGPGAAAEEGSLPGGGGGWRGQRVGEGRRVGERSRIGEMRRIVDGDVRR